jgi:hypothetical protein
MKMMIIQKNSKNLSTNTSCFDQIFKSDVVISTLRKATFASGRKSESSIFHTFSLEIFKILFIYFKLLYLQQRDVSLARFVVTQKLKSNFKEAEFYKIMTTQKISKNLSIYYPRFESFFTYNKEISHYLVSW